MYRQVIQEIQDLRRLDWSKVRHSSGTAGSFLKSREMIRGVKWYYKLSDYDDAPNFMEFSVPSQQSLQSLHPSLYPSQS